MSSPIFRAAANSNRTIGEVFLVGAGPGDPELLTVKAMRLLAAADVVVYDRLVSDEIMALVGPRAERISVGKQSGHHPVPQADINDILIHQALAGRRTVRLKGGDPFIFGRGSEEALALRAAGIACHVVPGITAAQGCAAAAGIPLTHRGLATGVRLVTGHCRQDEPLDFDWSSLADPQTTLVIYMGAANIAEISARLIEEGLSPATPVLAINNGTTPKERRVRADLAGIERATEDAAFAGPVLFIVGAVVSLYANGTDSPPLRETVSFGHVLRSVATHG